MATTADRHYIDIDINSAKAARQLRSIDKNLKRTQKSASSMQRSFSRLNAGLGLLVGANLFGGMIKDAVRMVDSYNEIGGRLRQVLDETLSLEKAQSDLNDAAMETYTSYDAIATLYIRTGLAAKELNLQHQDLVTFTKSVALTLRLSGASAQEARSSMLQLSQALASGRLSGDEFRSISEGNVAMMSILEKQLGKTKGEVIEMSKSQELTAKKIVPALIEAYDELSRKVGQIPLTVGRATNNLQTAWQRLVAEVVNSETEFDSVASSIEEFANQLNDPGFRAGISSLVGGFVTLGRVIMEVITGFANFGRWLGTGIGRMVTQAEINSMSHELKRIYDDVQMYQNGLDKGWYGKGDRFDEISLKVKGLRQEYNRLYTTIKGLQEGMDNGFFAGTDKPEEFAGPPRSLMNAPGGGGSGGGGGGGGGAGGKLSPFQKLIKDAEEAQAKIDNFLPTLDKLDSWFFDKAGDENVYDRAMESLFGLSSATGTASNEMDNYLKSIKLINEDTDIWWQKQEKLVEWLNNGTISLKEYNEAAKEFHDTAEDTAPKLDSMMVAIGNAVKGFTGDLSDAIVDFALTGEKSFADMAKSMVASLAKVILQTQMVDALGTAFNSLFKNANGNVFQGGQHLQAYARGGVVTSPTIFPMASGAGLMGEAGPEAVMPLTRINGKLGVEASGSGTVVNVINNSGGEATVTEQPNGRGGFDIQVLIERAVDNYIGSGGANSMFGAQFGARPIPR